MQRLRNRLIAAFLVATALPLAAAVWVATSLLDRSLDYATTTELDRLSRTLEETARQLYQREREALREDAHEGRVEATTHLMLDRRPDPAEVRAFWEGGEPERFALSGAGGHRVDYLQRDRDRVLVYTRDMGGIRMQDLSDQFREARERVARIEDRDLHRGFTLTLLLLIAAVWMASLVPLMFIASRISRPIRELTAGLTDLAAGDWNRRIAPTGSDEVGRAVAAFNHMADQLRNSRERLVYLTQMSSWQTLARKTAHELKNSLTPIRLTVEEILARGPAADPAFLPQAAAIVISEIETLERRVRSFSEFASEPRVAPELLDVHAMVAERVALLGRTHPGMTYDVRPTGEPLHAYAPGDLVKGILTNLLENAADAAGTGGRILIVLGRGDCTAVIEVHDSGPGLRPDAAATVFEPTITFKRDGMGLGLSIARKHALLSGGDVTVIAGELRGAAFRVSLPAVQAAGTAGA